jgi:glycosyltransferase involved in cell wall biosynthesis
MSISAIIPMKNEKGNVGLMISSVAELNNLEKIIFIDGDSNDGTYEFLLESIKIKNNERVIVLKQTKPFGKFNAIKQAASHIESDNILIWDGDNTIPVSDVKNIVNIYVKLVESNSNVFVVANRITKKKEKKSFRLLNLLGNYIVSFAMKLILKDKVPDVLSGVKIFPSNILTSVDNCKKAMSLDNFGDLALLSNGAKNNLQIYSVACNYQVRFYGNTSIGRWNGGFNMLKVFIHVLLHKCSKA